MLARLYFSYFFVLFVCVVAKRGIIYSQDEPGAHRFRFFSCLFVCFFVAHFTGRKFLMGESSYAKNVFHMYMFAEHFGRDLAGMVTKPQQGMLTIIAKLSFIV